MISTPSLVWKITVQPGYIGSNVAGMRLAVSTLGQLPIALRPSPGPSEISIGQVHLGVGAFHRAHQAVFSQVAMAASGTAHWGICGASQRSATALEALLPQDCLYSVTERAEGHCRTQVIASLREVLFAQQQWEDLQAQIASPSVTVLTTTVSEKGYRAGPVTGSLRTDDPDVVADSLGRQPVSVVGRIARALQARMRTSGGPITVLCCDNLPHNGNVLEGLVFDFCAMLPAGQAAALANWIATHVAFPNTVVDRIVPSPTHDDRSLAASVIGCDDKGALICEPFIQWAIEDRFAALHPPWEQVGALIVSDVEPYEQLKLRLHTAVGSSLAYLGSLAGFGLMAEAAQDLRFAGFANLLVETDVKPVLSVPDSFDVDGYRETLVSRFANWAVRQTTAQVASDGSQKLPYRLVATARDLLALGVLPRYISLAIAAWMRYVSAGRDDNGRELSLQDPMADVLHSVLPKVDRPELVVDALLSLREIFPSEIAENDAFRVQLTTDLDELGKSGAATVVGAMVTGRR